MRTGTFTAAAIIASMSGTALGQAASWNNPSGGTWNTASNWMPSIVPNGTTFDVTLGLAGAYTVDVNINPTIGSLSIVNPSAALNIEGGRTLTLEPGTLLNEGSIILNELGTVFDARLVFTGASTIVGTGEIVLSAASGSGSPADARVETSGPFTLTLGAAQTIRGNGQLSGTGTLVNLGTIRGDDPLGPGILVTTTIAQSGAGAIDVADGFVTMGSGSLLTGGQVVGAGSGALRIEANPASINSVTLNAPVNVLGTGRTLAMLGPIVNNSTITLNSDSNLFNAVLSFDTSTSITGSGSIVMLAPTSVDDAEIRASTGFVGTIGAGQAVSGSGRVRGTVVLNGSMTATNPSRALSIEDTLSGAGTLAAADGCRLEFSSATVSDLTFQAAGTGVVAAAAGETFLTNITNNGNAGILGTGARIALLGDLTNNGNITLNLDSSIFNSTIDFDATASILGTGTIRMIAQSNVDDSQIITSDAAVGTFGPGQSIAGAGRISGNFVNLGVINGDDPTRELVLIGTMTGPGTIRSDAGRVNMSNLTVSAHAFGSSAGGLVSASGGFSVLDDCTNAGDLGIDGNGVTLRIDTAFTNNGRVLINATDTIFNAALQINTPEPVAGNGSIVMETAGNIVDATIEAVNGPATLGPGQGVTGSGRLVGDITIEGTIDPAGDFRNLLAQGGTLRTLGTSVFDLGGLANDEFDRIGTGTNQVVELAGTVDINLDPGYTPEFGDQWTIVGGGNNTVINGAYDTFLVPAAPPSLAYRVFIEPSRVFVRLTCGADFNGDATLNFFDISNYIALFNAGDLRADLAAPLGTLNFFDIVTYIGIYNSGCN